MEKNLTMDIISREELKAKLNRGEDFKLVMTLNEWAFEAQHIPGSINVSSFADAQHYLSQEDEIVVYCSDSQPGRLQNAEGLRLRQRAPL